MRRCNSFGLARTASLVCQLSHLPLASGIRGRLLIVTGGGFVGIHGGPVAPVGPPHVAPCWAPRTDRKGRGIRGRMNSQDSALPVLHARASPSAGCRCRHRHTPRHRSDPRNTAATGSSRRSACLHPPGVFKQNAPLHPRPRPQVAAVADPGRADDRRTGLDAHVGPDIHRPHDLHAVPGNRGVEPTHTPGRTSVPGMCIWATSPRAAPAAAHPNSRSAGRCRSS
jgi:hypothetical protein